MQEQAINLGTNWAGISSVAFLVLLLPAVSLCMWALRKIERKRNPWTVKLHDAMQSVRMNDRDDFELEAMGWKPSPAPAHQCVADLERSPIVVNANGSATITCSVSGCGRTMVLGRDIAKAFIVESVTVAPKYYSALLNDRSR